MTASKTLGGQVGGRPQGWSGGWVVEQVGGRAGRRVVLSFLSMNMRLISPFFDFFLQCSAKLWKKSTISKLKLGHF